MRRMEEKKIGPEARKKEDEKREMKRIEKKMKKTTVKADRVKGRKEGRTMGILGKPEKEKEIKRKPNFFGRPSPLPNLLRTPKPNSIWAPKLHSGPSFAD